MRDYDLLEQLLETEWHVLHRGRRRGDGRPVLLKVGRGGARRAAASDLLEREVARKDRPLVKVNCSAISAGLVESELFGHVKGALTGAIERRVGRFELADGGTIFLDEVGELPSETQVKLLRVLQGQEFEPVGSSHTVRVDVRVIAATNRALEEAVQTGRFRADLFYRLNVFPIAVPPLRDRRADIPQLVMFSLTRFAKKFGKKVDSVSQDTMDRLMKYAWPGNIRELQNIIERSVVLSQGRFSTWIRLSCQPPCPVPPRERSKALGPLQKPAGTRRDCPRRRPRAFPRWRKWSVVTSWPRWSG